MSEWLLRQKDQITIELCRRSFWHYCKTLSPDFYKEERLYLKELCQTLQDLYEGKLLQKSGISYRKLIIEIPPRHGKSRTLTNFSSWILGKDKNNKIITGSYNDDLAQDFSRFTRDIISQERAKEEDIIYSDIFPDTNIKKGDASYKKWALEGQFFNYKGTGIGGSITGRGGNYLIVDDPVKDAEVAYNEIALDKIWLWYTGTFLSRVEEGGVQVICMTPWSKKDISSRVQELEEDWFIISMPVYDGCSMLCDEIYSYATHKERMKIADENIYSANYLMQRLDLKGQLYNNFKTYSELPQVSHGNIMYTDTADEGADFLCGIYGVKKDKYIYITDIIYTQDAQEKTEGLTVEKIRLNKTKEGWIESNGGGRAFARNVKRIADSKNIVTSIRWFHQSKNKKARIMTNSSIVQEYVLFPEGWSRRWPDFYKALITYQKEGKNKHDDAPDALTGLVEKYVEYNTEVSVPSVHLPL